MFTKGKGKRSGRRTSMSTTERLPGVYTDEITDCWCIRIGPHVEAPVWSALLHMVRACGPASTAAAYMVFISYPAMGIVCLHCLRQLSYNQFSVDSCRTYTGRPFRSMQHHAAPLGIKIVASDKSWTRMHTPDRGFVLPLVVAI